MSKISTYEVAPVPKLSDKLIGTSVGGEIEDATYNFTLLELLELYLPIIPANNLQGVLDYGNTATQDINLFGTITTTNLEVTDTANLFITYLNEETHIVGSLFDSVDSVGTAGQVLTSTGEGVEWYTLPPIFTPNLQQVLEVGNTAEIDILLDANIQALDVSSNTANIGTQLTIQGTVVDYNESGGTAGQVLSSTSTNVEWVNLPVYSATSPLLFNPATGVFSIQVANSTQGGYLTANDWVTFNGKQNAGSYITALTGEATATGPGSVPITLNNASVISKVLTGLNITGGSISASDSILTAFGKVQNQINGLMGGVQYQGVWDAATNTPTLTSSVGTQGHYYIVNVAGNTDLNGITDWKVGDWAIFSGGSWQKVDNTESVTSVNGQTGAVSLTTDNIPEGATNLYYLNSRARAALSFAAGSGAYNSLTGVITIPTNNNQILNGANYITLASLSATSPLLYNNLTGVFSIPQATALVNGYLSATDWSTFNGKQNYLGGTGLVKSTAGTITYITDNSGNWNTAYDRSIVSAAVTGTTTKTLTLNEQDGGTITASWTDLDTGLTSVGVSMPSAFSVANSPLTSNGTIAVTGAGTTLQYIDGTGALRTFPGLTGFVPYTGATQNVDLGEFGISAGYFQADLTPTGALQVGRMQWNATDGTMDLRLLGNNVTLQIGQENVTRVVNKSGIDLLEANYQVVRVRKVAEGGAQGQRLAVVLAQGNNENNSTEVIGLVTETILVNQEGFVTAFGEVKNINTTGSLQGETWVDGDILYLSDTVPGQLTKVRPIAPNHAVIVGYVTYAHANNGKIYMAIDTGYELGELHNVYAPSPTANQSIYWNVTNSRYELNTIGGILGYTPANAATTLTINGTTYDLSANRTWSVGTVTSVAALTLGTSGTDLSSTVANSTTTPVITLNVPTASAANRGALSAADWSTFNTKVGSVTATSPLFSSGGSTPNITIQQSSGSQDGYLSSTDWTTFNNKQAAGNYITSLTGEATGTGPGATAVTLNNASVTAKILTGINITGGTVQATDTMLTAFGKLQNQINGLIGSTIYQGTWNASTNTPALASGVGVRGYYYIVSVAGNTNLDGITDWFVGDWAIFDGTAWQQVDNTDAVVSVNGQTGAVSLTTDNIPEGATNQYYLNSRARAALSFTAGSGAYNSTTGVITIPTNTNQLTNGASFITLASLSGTAPIVYSNTTGAISITQSGTASNGFLSSTDWNTFNNKAPSVVGGYLPLSGGTMTGNINWAQNDSGLTWAVDTDGAYIKFFSTGDADVNTRLEFATTDNNNEYFRWVHVPSGGTLYESMRLVPVSNGNAELIVTGKIIKSGGTSSQYLMADGSVSTLTNPVTGTGTNNYLAKFTTTGSTIGNSQIFDNGTNVGVGTATPIGKLSSINSGVANTPSNSAIWLSSSSSAVSDGLGLGSSGTTAYKWIQSYDGTLVLNPVGNNVGIGNTNPLARLQVGNGTQTAINGADNKIHIATTATRSALLTLANSSGGTTVEGQFESSAESADLRIIIGSTSNHDVTIRTNNAERIRVAAATGMTTFSNSIQVGGAAIAGNSSTFYNTAAETTLAVKQTSGANKITLALWNDATTSDNHFLRFFTEASPNFRGAIHYDRAGSRLNIIGEGSGLLFTGLSTFSSNISTGGVAPYSNVAVSIRGTITGNDDSWGIYQNVTFAPSANSALVVGYHAGGSSSVNRGTFTNLSYRGFLQQDLGANTGTGTLQTTYGIYIDALTRGVNNYSAYFAQNVGIGTATPSYPLDVNGFGRFYAAQADIIVNATSTSQYSRVILQENGTDKAGMEYINSAFATVARRNKLELFNQGSIHFITSGSFVTPDFSIDASGNIRAVGTITGNITPLTTAATVFVTKDADTLRTRTAAEVRSDIGAQASGNYVTLDTAQTITDSKTFSKIVAGGTGDYTNMTSFPIRITGTSGPSDDYWRIPFLSNSSTISGVFNFQTGKNVFWGEPSDTGVYFFRGRTMNIQGLTGTTATFSGNVGTGGAASTYPLTVFNGANGTTAAFGGTARGLRIDNDGTFSSGRTTIFGVDNTFYGSYQPLSVEASTLVLQAVTGGNVGIGTNNPNAKLQVQVDTNFTGGVNYTTPHLFIRSGASAASGNVTRLAMGIFDGAQVYLDTICTSTGGGSADLAISTRNVGAPTEKLRITSGGNVGINNNNPQNRLTVNSPARYDGGTNSLGAAVVAGAISSSPSNDFTNSTAIFRINGTDATNNLQFGVGSDAYNYHPWIQGSFDNSGPSNNDFGAKDILLQPIGGNVGIGVITSPTRGLTIRRNNEFAALNIVKSNTSNQIVYLGTGSGAADDLGILQLSDGGTVKVQLYTGGISYFNGGNVSIRHTESAAYLDVAGIADQTNFSSVLIRAGNSDDSSPESNQILFGYANSANYAHAIKTRHQSGSQAGNSIEFWVWKYGDAISTPAGQRVMLAEGNGVRIANSSGTVNSMSASERLNVNGTVYATGYFETSDIRLKNVLSTTDGDIPAISYTWKDGRDNKLHWGYAAQDVMKYLPDAVSGSEYYGLDYNQVHTYKISIIESEVDVLKRKVSELEYKLQKYEA